MSLHSLKDEVDRVLRDVRSTLDVSVEGEVDVARGADGCLLVNLHLLGPVDWRVGSAHDPQAESSSTFLARLVQRYVIEEYVSSGYPWPACGSHPFHPLIVEDGEAGALWTCEGGEFSAAVGSLRTRRTSLGPRATPIGGGRHLVPGAGSGTVRWFSPSLDVGAIASTEETLLLFWGSQVAPRGRNVEVGDGVVFRWSSGVSVESLHLLDPSQGE